MVSPGFLQEMENEMTKQALMIDADYASFAPKLRGTFGVRIAGVVRDAGHATATAAARSITRWADNLPEFEVVRIDGPLKFV